MRTTSIETYNAIKNNGLLSRMRLLIYNELYNESGTISEICHRLKGQHQNLSPRFAELKNLKVIEESGTRACNVTGRTCIVWQTTNNLPTAYERKSKDKIIKELQDEIIKLKFEIEKLKFSDVQKLML